MKFLALMAPLLFGSMAQAATFTLVDETKVDASNIFTHPDLEKISPSKAGVPASIAHEYILRRTYNLIVGEADAKIVKVDPICEEFSCTEAHWQGSLDVISKESNFRLELIDAISGRILGTRNWKLDAGSLFQGTENLSGTVSFEGEIGFFPRAEEQDAASSFLLADGRHLLSISGPYEFAIYNNAKLIVKRKGNGDHYEAVGLKYGGVTETGLLINLVPGAEIPNAGVWMSRSTEDAHPFLLGEPGSARAFTSAVVTQVK